MTSIEEHKRKIRESLDEIRDAIEEGIENKPITIGFHCSACSVQLLELYLHLTNRIPMGKVVKHDWFKRPKPNQKKDSLVERKLSVDFPRKKEIYSLMYEIEDNRNTLVYGKTDREQIKKVVNTFIKLKNIFNEIFENEKFEI